MNSLRPLPLLAVALALVGCVQYATVSETRPHFRPLRATAGALVPVEQSITRGLAQQKREPVEALGELLAAAQAAQQQLVRNPNDHAARDAYNFAVARVVETIQRAKLNPWSEPLRAPGPNGGYLLTHKPDPRPNWNPAHYDFTPADQFDIKGKYVQARTKKEGIGAPLVAVGKHQRDSFRADFLTPRIYYGVTAVARFDAQRRCVISFEDPLQKETVALGGRSFPLAADYTVPLAVMLAQENPRKLEIARLLRPEKHAESARIARLQPYDPNKSVVLVVHGLMDSPATWAPMLNTLRGDPDIRRRYQFWFYSYPSGYPYPYSAAILRRELDAVKKRFGTRKPMVLIGHSMGGCISRLMITDSGDHLWRNYFKTPPEQTTLSPDSRKMLTESLFFRHRSEVGRVIFIAAPHRGSDMAKNPLGRIGSSLVKAPATLLSVGREALDIVTFDTGDLKLKRIPNSVDTLAPNNRFVKAVNTIPINADVPYHSIMGDRGRGDTPNSSDGVVPYWSSHLDRAQSELIVSSNHSAHQNPQAIAEVQRILSLHARN